MIFTVKWTTLAVVHSTAKDHVHFHTLFIVERKFAWFFQWKRGRNAEVWFTRVGWSLWNVTFWRVSSTCRWCIQIWPISLRASSPIWASLARTRERGAEERRVLARLTSLAQIGELARRLLTDGWPSQYIYTILDTSFVATKTISDPRRSISPKWRACSQANIHRLKLHSCISDFERRKSSRLVEEARTGRAMWHCSSTKQRFLFNKDFFLLGIFPVFVMWLVLDQCNCFEEATRVARLGRRDMLGFTVI